MGQEKSGVRPQQREMSGKQVKTTNKIAAYGESGKAARSDINAYFAQQATQAERPRVARKPIATPTKAQKLWMFNMGYEHHEQKPLYFGAHVRPSSPHPPLPSDPPRELSPETARWLESLPTLQAYVQSAPQQELCR